MTKPPDGVFLSSAMIECGVQVITSYSGSSTPDIADATSTASGIALAKDERRALCFIGNSSFFHAGLPGITNAVYNDHNVTLIVMENGTTAMTSHQGHPDSGKNFNGPAEKLSVRTVLEAQGAKNIREVDT